MSFLTVVHYKRSPCMHSLRSQFRRNGALLFSLLILFCIISAPDPQWAKSPVVAQCPAITLNPTSLPNATAGDSYSRTITASGGTGSYTFMIFGGALPPGLSITPSTGVISGTPTTFANPHCIRGPSALQLHYHLRRFTAGADIIAGYRSNHRDADINET